MQSAIQTLQGSAFVAMFDLVPDEDKHACVNRIVLQAMGYDVKTMPFMTRREKDAWAITRIRNRTRLSVHYSIMKPSSGGRPVQRKIKLI